MHARTCTDAPHERLLEHVNVNMCWKESPLSVICNSKAVTYNTTSSAQDALQFLGNVQLLLFCFVLGGLGFFCLINFTSERKQEAAILYFSDSKSFSVCFNVF